MSTSFNVFTRLLGNAIDSQHYRQFRSCFVAFAIIIAGLVCCLLSTTRGSVIDTTLDFDADTVSQPNRFHVHQSNSLREPDRGRQSASGNLHVDRRGL